MGGADGFFCEGCLAGVQELAGPSCGVCGRPFPDGSGGARVCASCFKEPPAFRIARAPYQFEGVVRDAIHQFKYGGLRAVEGFLSAPFDERLSAWFGEVDVVVPVPLHPARLRKRGFNQSLLLAKRAADALSAILSVDGLTRTRNTRPQVELDGADREKNVKGAFAAPRPQVFESKDVLLVDDVYTTGATVRECARVLSKAGARCVCVLTVARAVKD
jgi:ComF family protein